MSLDKLQDLKTYLEHLSNAKFHGSVYISFTKGEPTNISEKRELIVGKLSEATRGRVYVSVKPKKVPLEEQKTIDSPQDGVEVKDDVEGKL